LLLFFKKEGLSFFLGVVIKMVLDLLFDQKFDEYFAKAGGGTPLWLMVHVPKTAGSSLGVELAGLLAPSYNINIRKTDPTLGHRVRFDMAVAQFLEAAQKKPHRFATGHISGDQAQLIMSTLPEVRAFAMLRHPVARFVSDFRYQRTPMHSDPEGFKARYPDFPSYVNTHRVYNKITSHLVPKSVLDTNDAQACIDHITKTFTFIGLQEAYPISFRVITTLAGTPARATVKERVNTPTAENSVELTPDLERTIRENNPIDMAVFVEFSRRFRAIRDGLAAWLKTGRKAA
jgi:hypothetical protein